MSRVRDRLVEVALRRPARRQTYAEHLAALDKGGSALLQRMSKAAPTGQNCDQLRHIIGIERWGQRRLATILGDPALDDDYDGYRPAASLDWLSLRQELAQTRRQTIALVRKIAARGISDELTARHNTAGELNAREWLQYLRVHSRVEALGIR